MAAVRAPELCEPEVALVPVQAPEAVQDVAPVELHVNVVLLPLVTEDGFAISDTVTGLPPPTAEPRGTTAQFG